MTFWSDVRLAARLVVKDKAFTLAAVVVLALGIAANNTVFTLVNGVLLRDLPFHEPDRVVELGVRDLTNARNPLGGLSYLDLRDWQRSARTFDAIGAADQQTMNVSEEGRPAERFLGAFVSANTFALIGQRPMLGRDFRADDDREGATPIVIIGHTAWRNRYQSDPNVIGRTIRVNGVASVIIGVMPEGFGFPLNAGLWKPLAALDSKSKNERQSRFLDGFGRLKTGVTTEQAMADLRGVTSALASQYPDTNKSIEPRVGAFRSGIGDPILGLFVAMMGAVAFVLLIACANVANLMLSRASARAREVSVRMSIGASRWRIVRQLLVESLLLAAIAGVLGLALSFAAIRAFWTLASQTDPPYWLQFPMDWRVFAFLAAVCLGTSVLFGLVPALHTSKTSLVAVLNETGRANTGNLRSRRLTGALVVGQLALTLVLLTGAGLMMRSLLIRSTMDAGVDTAGLVRMRLDLPASAYDGPEQRRAFYRRLEERLASLPGLRAALSSNVPQSGGAPREVQIEGQSQPDPGRRPLATLITIGKGYFESLGTRPVRGRTFVDGDGDAGRGVVIVNERFAAVHFAGDNALGQRVRVTEPGAAERTDAEWMTIVGVAQNVQQRAPREGGFDPVVYLPYASSAGPINILVRSEADPALVASVLREQVAAIDADLPVFDVRTVDDLLAYGRWPDRVFGSMFVIFAGIALVLATVGLYAVTAYSVAQRTREIGVRMALGAQARQVWWLVTRRASGQLAVGLLLGVAGAVAVSRVLPAILAGTVGTDPLTIAIVSGLLVGVAVVACLIPARRATRLDPVTALRSE
jgi:putative ABC transport system permease protein